MNLSVFNEFLLIALLILAALLVRFFIGREFCAAAEEKGYTSNKYLWWILFTGIPGMLLVAALPDRREDCFASLPVGTQPFQHAAGALPTPRAERPHTSTASSSARMASQHVKSASAGTATAAVKSGSSQRSLEAQDCDSLPRL